MDMTPTTADSQPAAVSPPLPTETAAPPLLSASRSPAPVPTQSPAPSNTLYSLTATLDYDRHHLDVEETIRYTNPSSEPLNDLLLMVEPAYYPGVFQLKSMSWEDGQQVDGSSWDGTRLRFPLRSPLPPRDRLNIFLSYTLDLPSPTPSPTTRPVPFGYTARQVNLVDWYPFVPPYIPGQGWLAHPQGYFGEHLAYDESDFEVEIHLAKANSVSGQPLIVAASAPAEKDGELIYRYKLESARNFVWSASDQYAVTSVKVGEVTVMGYAFAMHASAGEVAMKTTAQALELYSRLFGPYPRQLLTVVEADFLDGMEYDGLYFLSNGFYNLYQGTPGEYMVAIAAHETAHQWWYAMVGNDQAQEPWLDEALCTYSERIFYENTYPDALDWWWAYRVKYYNPTGWVDGSIYNPNGYRAYRDAVYLNGAMFLEDLRKQVGDEVFFAFLKDYAGQFKGRIASGKDFFAVLSKHSSVDISGLIKTYFQKDPRN
jgi:hypothetical protein